MSCLPLPPCRVSVSSSLKWGNSSRHTSYCPGKLTRVNKAFSNTFSHTVGALGNGSGGDGYHDFIHSPVSSFCCCATSYRAFSSLKQHAGVISQFLWARHQGTGELGPLLLAFSQDLAGGVSRGCISRFNWGRIHFPACLTTWWRDSGSLRLLS